MVVAIAVIPALAIAIALVLAGLDAGSTDHARIGDTCLSDLDCFKVSLLTRRKRVTRNIALATL